MMATIQNLTSLEDFEMLSYGDVLQVNNQNVVYSHMASKNQGVIRKIKGNTIAKMTLNIDSIQFNNTGIRCLGQNAYSSEQYATCGEAVEQLSTNARRQHYQVFDSLDNKLKGVGL